MKASYINTIPTKYSITQKLSLNWFLAKLRKWSFLIDFLYPISVIFPLVELYNFDVLLTMELDRS